MCIERLVNHTRLLNRKVLSVRVPTGHINHVAGEVIVDGFGNVGADL